MHDIVSSTMANPIPSVTNTQVASSGLPVASAASAPNPIPSAKNVQVASSGPSQTSTVAAAPFAAPLQGDIFEDGLPPAGGGPQSQTTWDPRLPYTDSMMQHNTRGYTGYRGPRLDHAGREPLRLQSRPPSEDRWGVAGHHDNYHNQDRRRGYQEVMWDGNHRDEYREVRRGGRDGLGGMRLVKRSIERSGEWDAMKEGGPWGADMMSAVFQKPGKWDGSLRVRTLHIMVLPSTQQTTVTHTTARAPL